MATDAQAGKDRDTKDTTSAADRAASGGGKSGTGGSGRAGGVGSPGVGGGFDGTGKGSAGNSKDYSGRGGMDSPSEGGPGRGVSGSSSGSAGNAGGEGEGSRYSGRGGLNSPGEVARAADGFGLNGSSVDAPKNYNYSDLGKAGSVGLYSAAQGGPGGPLAGSVGSYSTARGLMGAAGATIPDVTHRQAEIASMEALSAYGKEVVSVVDAGKGWTTVELRDGTIERRDGTRASRNNNPGNIEYGNYARTKGAIGTDGRFAVFSTPQQGIQAMKDLVFGPNYAGKTISQAIEKYAPSFENDSKAYAATVAAAAGVEVSTPTSSLTEVQKDKMIEAMTRVEGGKPYDVATVQSGRWGTEGYSGKSGTTAASSSTEVSQAAPKSNLSWEAQQYQYAGQTKQQAPTEVAQYARTARFRDMYISPHLPLDVQGFTEEDVARRTPEVDRMPVGVTTAQTQPAPVPSTPATSAPTTVTTTTAPTALPETGIQPVRTEDRISPTPADDTIEPDKQRSIPAQIAAGGIDVLTGLVPGVGIGASLLNAGAALTGHRTLGERLVDDFLSGDNPGRPAGTRDSDSLLVREDENADGQGEEAEAEAAPVAFDKNRFVRKYLTPAEKWGASRGLMGAAA